MLLITPHNNSPHLATVLDGELVYLRSLSDYHATVWTKWDEGLLFLDQEKRVLHLARADGSVSVHCWTLPANLDCDASQTHMATIGNRIFISGFYVKNKKPTIFTRSLTDEMTNWSDCYPNSFHWRKHIDALLIQGQQLIAVDNEVHPKYLFYINDADKDCTLAEIVELDSHGTYEHIYSASLCKNYIAIISITECAAGKGVHLFFINTSSFKQSGALNIYGYHCRPNDIGLVSNEVSNALLSFTHSSKALAACAEYLVVACGKNGLVIAHPERIVDKNSTKREYHGNRQGVVASLLSLHQLPLHQLQKRQLVKGIKAVEFVIGAGELGCIVVVSLVDDTMESFFVNWALLNELLP